MKEDCGCKKAPKENDWVEDGSVGDSFLKDKTFSIIFSIDENIKNESVNKNAMFNLNLEERVLDNLNINDVEVDYSYLDKDEDTLINYNDIYSEDDEEEFLKELKSEEQLLKEMESEDDEKEVDEENMKLNKMRMGDEKEVDEENMKLNKMRMGDEKEVDEENMKLNKMRMGDEKEVDEENMKLNKMRMGDEKEVDEENMKLNKMRMGDEKEVDEENMKLNKMRMGDEDEPLMNLNEEEIKKDQNYSDVDEVDEVDEVDSNEFQKDRYKNEIDIYLDKLK